MAIQLKFTPRPVSIPPNLRLYRRLAMLCISLSKCCPDNKGSFEQLHFINALYADDQFRALYLEFKAQKFSLKILSPSADPYLNRCANFAIGSGLVGQKEIKTGFRVELLPEGKVFVRQLKEKNLAADIFSISDQIGKISASEVKRALRLRN